MNDCFLHMQFYARRWMIEQIMTLIGRSSPNPKRYRELLESFETATLRRTLEQLHESPSFNFPATSLTENAGVIASADTGTVPGSSRDP
jgi:hypothetical protein